MKRYNVGIKITNEYDISYAVKEWLIKHGWRIIAFNPPGAQGTFTIPNPSKDRHYRGQTGSKSPDVIAVKGSKYLIIIESKPTFNVGDSEKLLGLLKSKARLNLLIEIVVKTCKANKVNFARENCTLILGKAHNGRLNLLPNIETFHVAATKNWKSDVINTSVDPLDYMKVDYYPSSKDIEKIIRS